MKILLEVIFCSEFSSLLKNLITASTALMPSPDLKSPQSLGTSGTGSSSLPSSHLISSRPLLTIIKITRENVFPS
jgi:hypothetical protein